MTRFLIIGLVFCHFQCGLKAQSKLFSLRTFNHSTSGFISSFHPESYSKKQAFLFEAYTSGYIRFFGSPQLYQAKQMRLNLWLGYLEVVIKGKVVRFNESDIKLLIFNPQNQKLTLINAKHYTINGVEATGFMQIIEDGRLQLLKHTKVQVTQAIYSSNTNFTSHSHTLEQKESYYFAQRKHLYKITRKKSVYHFFQKQNFAIKECLKTHKINLRKEVGLRYLVKLYNASADRKE